MRYICMWVLCLLVACSTYTPIDVEEPPPASGSTRIAAQTTFGSPERRTTLWEIDQSPSGGYYVRGSYQDDRVIGTLSSTGIDLQTAGEPFVIRDLLALPGAIGGASSVALLAGWHEANGTHPNYYLALAAYQDLTPSTQFELASDTLRVWSNGLGLISTTAQQAEVIAVGGVAEDVHYYPFMLRVRVESNLSWTILQQKIFYEAPLRWFNDVVVAANGMMYVAGANSGSPDSAFVWCISPDLDVAWEVGVRPDNVDYAVISGIALGPTALYAVGRAGVVKAGDQRWSSGLVAAAALDGSLAWSKVVSVSDWGDRYNNCAADGNALYACGRAFSAHYYDTNRKYGHALLTRFDGSTGNVDYHLTFGDTSFESGFNSLEVAGSQATCVGWTRYGLLGYGFQGWYVDIDLTGAVTTELPSFSSLIDMRRAVPVEDSPDEKRARAGCYGLSTRTSGTTSEP